MSGEHKNCKYRFKGKSCEDCPLNCKFKRLQEENEELKKRQITKNGFICDCEQNAKYRQALEEIKEIIEFRFKTAYMTLGLKETDKIIEDIEKVANEVLNDRD